MTLENFIWSKFPDRFSEEDTNKDGDGKGTFQRFLSIFGLELDQVVVPGIEAFLDNVNPETAADELLGNIAYAVGTPDDILGDADKYRDFLISIISLYQIKGTTRSYKLLFGLLGLSVEVIENFPGDNTYDMDIAYDDDGGLILYDNDLCGMECIHYNLVYQNLPGSTTAPLSDDLKVKLRALIENLIQPHSAELDELTYNAPVLAKTLIIKNYSGRAIRYLDPDLNEIDMENGQVQVVPNLVGHIIIEAIETDTYDYVLNGSSSEPIQVETNHTIIVLFDAQLMNGDNELIIECPFITVTFYNNGRHDITLNGVTITPAGNHPITLGTKGDPLAEYPVIELPSTDNDWGLNFTNVNTETYTNSDDLANSINTQMPGNFFQSYNRHEVYIFEKMPSPINFYNHTLGLTVLADGVPVGPGESHVFTGIEKNQFMNLVVPDNYFWNYNSIDEPLSTNWQIDSPYMNDLLASTLKGSFLRATNAGFDPSLEHFYLFSAPELTIINNTPSNLGYTFHEPITGAIVNNLLTGATFLTSWVKPYNGDTNAKFHFENVAKIIGLYLDGVFQHNQDLSAGYDLPQLPESHTWTLTDEV